MSSDPRRPRPLFGGRRSLLSLVCAVTMLTGGGASAAPRVGQAASVSLASRTTISWTGAKAIRLKVPADTQLPWYGARLTVRGGTYAFVRIAFTRSCELELRCLKGYLSYTRDMAPFLASGDGPGTDHLTRIGANHLYKADFELYLFTDGAATLTFDRTGLTGRATSAVATGRVRGGVRPIPVTCATPACAPPSGYGGRVRLGGDTFDVGRGGSADFLVVTYDRATTPVVAGDYPNARTVRACAYPRGAGDPTPSDPSRHPYGCDTADRDTPVDAANAAVAVATAGKAYFLQGGNPSGAGRVWMGFQMATAHDLAEPVLTTYGVFFEYGIR